VLNGAVDAREQTLYFAPNEVEVLSGTRTFEAKHANFDGLYYRAGALLVGEGANEFGHIPTLNLEGVDRNAGLEKLDVCGDHVSAPWLGSHHMVELSVAGNSQTTEYFFAPLSDLRVFFLQIRVVRLD